MADACRYNNATDGFTLLEVMTAVLLLALSYVAVLESFSSSMQRLVKLEKSLESFVSQDIQLTQDIKFSGPALFDEESAGEIFLEGTTYLLTVVSSEEGLLHSLQLSKQ
ncbi:MAG: type II secretion system GspH family protein [Proteobacteria bacterium]|nr:type II secretion system GspH family protein [Pseudomonadota bacterium]MBU1639618.1 type II secretion system GspH family protein [Pseudomonadota bacterium]